LTACTESTNVISSQLGVLSCISWEKGCCYLQL